MLLVVLHNKQPTVPAHCLTNAACILGIDASGYKQEICSEEMHVWPKSLWPGIALLAHRKPNKLTVLLSCSEEIASCSEKAYSSLAVWDVKKLMLLRSDEEAQSYAIQVSMHAGPCILLEKFATLGPDEDCKALLHNCITSLDRLNKHGPAQATFAPHSRCNCSVAQLHIMFLPGTCREAGPYMTAG